MHGDAFVLIGGPRDGQIVDETPSGYRALGGAGPVVELCAGVEAEGAVWVGAAAGSSGLPGASSH